MIDIKQYIWRILSAGIMLVPSSVRKQLCALAFESWQGQTVAEIKLKALLEVQSKLRWYVDQQAIRYEGGVHPKHRLMNYHRFFIERLDREDRVLDIGCGCGALAGSIAATGTSVTGVDIDPLNIGKAREWFSHAKAEFFVGDITLNLPEGRFSVLVMSNILEHLEKRSILLRSLVGFYSPRIILLRVPMSNRHWEVPLRMELGLPYFSDPTHCIEYTPELLKNEMEEAGLEIIYYQICWGEIWAELKPVESTSASHEGVKADGI